MATLDWHVLVVDDDQALLEEVEGWLKSNDIRVSTAPDGAAALALLKQGLDPDVILSDIKMPTVDGFEFFDAVRENAAWNSTRFVFLVEHDDEAFLRHAEEMGIDSPLLKPFGKKELLYAVLDGVKLPKAERISARAGQAAARSENGDAGKLNMVPNNSSEPRRSMRYTTPPPTASAATEIKGYVGVLGRYKWVLLLCMVVAVSAAWFVTERMEPTYASTSTMRIVSAPSGIEQDIWSVDALATRLLNTYAQIVDSGPVLREMANRLDRTTAPEIEVEIVPNSELLRITAFDSDPEVAAAAVNHLADIMRERSLELYTGDTRSARDILEEQLQVAETEYRDALDAYETGVEEGLPEDRLDVMRTQVGLREQAYITLLQRYENIRIDEQLRANAITVVEPGYVPDAPVIPNRMLNLGLGLAGGLAAGLLLAFVLNSFDTTVRNVNEVEKMSGLPVLTKLPQVTGRLPWRRKAAPLQVAAYPISADAYRQLSVRLRIQNVLSEHGSILVTSPEKGSGKTTVVANLGLTLARAGYSTILVDGDLRSPGLHSIFKVSNKTGLAEVLKGQPLDSALQPTNFSNLRVLPAGISNHQDLSEIATPERISGVLADLLKDCEYLIVDAPSVLAVADAAVLAALSDAVVVVVSQRLTTREAFHLTLQYLEDIQANLIGVVVNRIPMSLLSKYYSHDRRAALTDGSRPVSSKVSS